MIIHFDTLKCAKMLKKSGFRHDLAEGIINVLSITEIRNLYSKDEVDDMLGESVEAVFRKQDVKLEKLLEQQDKKLAEQRREFDKRIELAGHRIETEISEIRSLKRWAVGTIITVGLALTGFISSLIHSSY